MSARRILCEGCARHREAQKEEAGARAEEVAGEVVGKRKEFVAADEILQLLDSATSESNSYLTSPTTYWSTYYTWVNWDPTNFLMVWILGIIGLIVFSYFFLKPV